MYLEDNQIEVQLGEDKNQAILYKGTMLDRNNRDFEKTYYIYSDNTISEVFGSFDDKDVVNSYQTINNIVLKTNSSIELNLFNHYIVTKNGYASSQQTKITPNNIELVEVNGRRVNLNNPTTPIIWNKETSMLQTFGTITTNINQPNKLVITYKELKNVGTVANPKYEYETVTKTINVWVFDTITSIDVDTINNIPHIYEASSLGYYNQDMSKYTPVYSISPSVETLGGLITDNDTVVKAVEV